MRLRAGLLRRGMRGPQVRLLQEKLDELGFSPGSADGIFGARTEAAVKAFQRANGLAADGIVGKNTAGSLNAATAAEEMDFTEDDDFEDDTEIDEDETSSAMPEWGLGSEGDEVAQLQADLMELGYAVMITGTFDDATQVALQQFQLNSSLEPTGVATPDLFVAIAHAKAMAGL